MEAQLTALLKIAALLEQILEKLEGPLSIEFDDE
jgi:hypothetical protein